MCRKTWAGGVWRIGAEAETEAAEKAA